MELKIGQNLAPERGKGWQGPSPSTLVPSVSPGRLLPGDHFHLTWGRIYPVEIVTITAGKLGRDRDRASCLWFTYNRDLCLEFLPDGLRVQVAEVHRVLDSLPLSVGKDSLGTDLTEKEVMQKKTWRSEASCWRAEQSGVPGSASHIHLVPLILAFCVLVLPSCSFQ